MANACTSVHYLKRGELIKILLAFVAKTKLIKFGFEYSGNEPQRVNCTWDNQEEEASHQMRNIKYQVLLIMLVYCLSKDISLERSNVPMDNRSQILSYCMLNI